MAGAHGADGRGPPATEHIEESSLSDCQVSLDVDEIEELSKYRCTLHEQAWGASPKRHRS